MVIEKGANHPPIERVCIEGVCGGVNSNKVATLLHVLSDIHRTSLGQRRPNFRRVLVSRMNKHKRIKLLQIVEVLKVGCAFGVYGCPACFRRDGLHCSRDRVVAEASRASEEEDLFGGARSSGLRYRCCKTQELDGKRHLCRIQRSIFTDE